MCSVKFGFVVQFPEGQMPVLPSPADAHGLFAYNDAFSPVPRSDVTGQLY